MGRMPPPRRRSPRHIWSVRWFKSSLLLRIALLGSQRNIESDHMVGVRLTKESGRRPAQALGNSLAS
jgi:hypothetical protein